MNMVIIENGVTNSIAVPRKQWREGVDKQISAAIREAKNQGMEYHVMSNAYEAPRRGETILNCGFLTSPCDCGFCWDCENR